MASATRMLLSPSRLIPSSRPGVNMPYVRTLTFTVPPDRVDELSPGHNLYLAAVFGTQIAAQNTQGYQKGGVWMQRQTEGSTLVFMFSQWDELDSMEAYANL